MSIIHRGFNFKLDLQRDFIEDEIFLRNVCMLDENLRDDKNMP